MQSNALKFTKAGGRIKITTIFVPAASEENNLMDLSLAVGGLHVIIDMLKPGQHAKIVVSVEDTGVGISEQD